MRDTIRTRQRIQQPAFVVQGGAAIVQVLTQLREFPADRFQGGPVGAHDFDFFHGRWTVRNRRLLKRLAGCDEWEEFEATVECRPSAATTKPACTVTTDDGHWPGFVQGRPAGINPKTTSATYMWHDGNGWHIRVTHRTTNLRSFSGQISSEMPKSNGTIWMSRRRR